MKEIERKKERKKDRKKDRKKKRKKDRKKERKTEMGGGRLRVGNGLGWVAGLVEFVRDSDRVVSWEIVHTWVLTHDAGHTEKQKNRYKRREANGEEIKQTSM